MAPSRRSTRGGPHQCRGSWIAPATAGTILAAFTSAAPHLRSITIIITMRRDVSLVDSARQETPVGLPASEKPGARAVWRWARLGSGHDDQVRHLRDRGGREKDRVGCYLVVLVRPSTSTGMRAREEAGTIRPAGRV